MFSPTQIGTRDFAAACAFYAPIMAQLGLLLKFREPQRELAGWRKPGAARPSFLVGCPFDGQPARPGNGQTIAILAAGHEIVDRCHALALRSGGLDEGAPGIRPGYHPHYYGGYFRDLDGNKLCVVCHDAAGGYRLRRDDPTSESSLALVALHLAGMRGNSPPGSVFALDGSALRQADVSFWTIWDGENIAGMAALKTHPDGLGEIKSMRTHPAYLRLGVGRRLLEHLTTQAVERGMTRLSLETGSGPGFEPALALYRQRGFRNGAAFADYAPSGFSQFLHLDL